MSSLDVLALFQNTMQNVEVAWFSPTGWRVVSDCESVPVFSLVRVRVLKRSVAGSNEDSFNDVTSATMEFFNENNTEFVNAFTDDLGNIVSYAYDIANFNTDGTVNLSVYVEIQTPSGPASNTVPLVRKIRVSSLVPSHYGTIDVATSLTNVVENQENGIGLPGLTQPSGAVDADADLTGLVTVWRQDAGSSTYLFDLRQGYPFAQSPLNVWHAIPSGFVAGNNVSMHAFQQKQVTVQRWDSAYFTPDRTVYDSLASVVTLSTLEVRFCASSVVSNVQSLSVTVSAGAVTSATMSVRQVTSQDALFVAGGLSVAGAGPGYTLTGDLLVTAPLGQYQVVQRLTSGTVVRENVSASTLLVLNAASVTAPTSDDVWVGSMFTVPAQDTVKVNDVVHVEVEVTCNGAYDPASVAARADLLTAFITYRADAARMQTGIRIPLRRVGSTPVWRGFVQMGDELYRMNLGSALLGVTLCDQDDCGNKFWKVAQCAQIKYVDVVQPQLLDAEVCLVNEACVVQEFPGTGTGTPGSATITDVVLPDAAWAALTVGSLLIPSIEGYCFAFASIAVESWDREAHTITLVEPAAGEEPFLFEFCLQVGMADKFCGLCAGVRQRVAVPLGCVVDVAGVSELFIVPHWTKEGVEFEGEETRMFIRVASVGSTDFVDQALGTHYEAYLDLCALNDALSCFAGFSLRLRVAELNDDLADKQLVVSNYCQIWQVGDSYAVFPINTTDASNLSLEYVTVDRLVSANVAAPYVNVETDGFSALGFYWQNVSFAEIRVSAASIGPLSEFTFRASATAGSAVLSAVVLDAAGWAALAKNAEVNCASAFVGDALIESFSEDAKTVTLKSAATSTVSNALFYVTLASCTLPENMQVFVRVESFNDGQPSLNYVPNAPYWRQMTLVRVNDAATGAIDLDASYWQEAYNISEFKDAWDGAVLQNSIGRTRWGARFRVVDRTCNYAQTSQLVSKIKNDPYADYAASHATENNVGGFWLLDDATAASVNAGCCARWAYVAAGSTSTNAPLLKEPLTNSNGAVLVHVPIDAMVDAESGVLQSGASFQARVVSAAPSPQTTYVNPTASNIFRPVSSSATCDSSCAHINRAAALVYGNGAYRFTATSSNGSSVLTGVVADWDVFTEFMSLSGPGIGVGVTVVAWDAASGEVQLSGNAGVGAGVGTFVASVVDSTVSIGKLLVRGAGQLVGGWAGASSQLPAVGLWGASASATSIDFLVVENAGGVGLEIEGGELHVARAHITSAGVPLLVSEGAVKQGAETYLVDEAYLSHTGGSALLISAPYISGAGGQYLIGTTNASASAPNVDVPANVTIANAGACSLAAFNCADVLHPYRLPNLVVNGDVLESATWFGIVQVNCECIVHAGVTLTIMPGTEVRFATVDVTLGRRPVSLVIAPGASLYVANLDDTDAPVCFVPTPQFGAYPSDSGLWGGLHVVGNGDAYRGSPAATFQDVPTLYSTVYYDGFHILMSKSDGYLNGVATLGVAPWSVTLGMKATNGGNLQNLSYQYLTTCAVSSVSDFRQMARDAASLILQVQNVIALMHNGLDSQAEILARCVYEDVEGALNLDSVTFVTPADNVVAPLPYAPLVMDPESPSVSTGECPPLITLYECENECELTLLPLGYESAEGAYVNSLNLCGKYVIDVNVCDWFTAARYPVGLGAATFPLQLSALSFEAQLIAYDETQSPPVQVVAPPLVTQFAATLIEQSPLRTDSVRLTFHLPSWLPTFTSYRLQMKVTDSASPTPVQSGWLDVLRFIHVTRVVATAAGTCNGSAPYDVKLALLDPWASNHLILRPDCTQATPTPNQVYVRVKRTDLTADDCDYELTTSYLTQVDCGEGAIFGATPTYDSETGYYTLCFDEISLVNGYYKLTLTLIAPSYALSYVEGEPCTINVITDYGQFQCQQSDLLCVTPYTMVEGATTCLRNFHCYSETYLGDVPTFCLGELVLPLECPQLFAPTFADDTGGFTPYTPAYYGIIRTVGFRGNVWMETEDGEYRVNVIVTRRPATVPGEVRYLLTVRPWHYLIFVNQGAGWIGLGDCNGVDAYNLSCRKWRLFVDVTALPASFAIVATQPTVGSNTLTVDSGYPLPSSQNPPLPGAGSNLYYVSGAGVQNTYPIATGSAVQVVGYNGGLAQLTIGGVTTSALAGAALLLYHKQGVDPTTQECLVPIALNGVHAFVETVGDLVASLFSPPYAIKQSQGEGLVVEGEACLPPWMAFKKANGTNVDSLTGYEVLTANGACITAQSTLFVFEDTADADDIIGFLKLSCGQAPYTVCMVEPDQDSAANVLRIGDFDGAGPWFNDAPIPIELASNPFPANRNTCTCVDVIVQDACCETYTYRIFVVFVPRLSAVVKVCNDVSHPLGVLHSSDNVSGLDWLQVCCEEGVSLPNYSFQYQVNGEVLMALSDVNDACYAGIPQQERQALVSTISRTMGWCNNAALDDWSPSGSNDEHEVRNGVTIYFNADAQAQCNEVNIATAAEVFAERETAGRWWSWCYQYGEGQSKEIVSNGLYTTDDARYLSDRWTVEFNSNAICASLCTEETFVSSGMQYTFFVGPAEAPVRKITFDVESYLLQAREYINKIQLGEATDCANTEAIATPSSNYPVYDINVNSCAVIADNEDVLNACGDVACFWGLRMMFFKPMTVTATNFDWREVCCAPDFENPDALNRVVSRSEAWRYLGRCIELSGGYSRLFAPLSVYETNYVQGCGEGWYDLLDGQEDPIEAYKTQVVYATSFPCDGERPAPPSECFPITQCASDVENPYGFIYRNLVREPGQNFVFYTRACYVSESDEQQLKMVLPLNVSAAGVPDYYSARSAAGQEFANVETNANAWAAQYQVTSVMKQPGQPDGSCTNAMNLMCAMKNVLHVQQINPCNPQQTTYDACVLNLYSFDWLDRISECIFPFVMSQTADGNGRSIWSVSPRVGWGLCPPISSAVSSAWNPLLLSLRDGADCPAAACSGSASVTECSDLYTYNFVNYDFCGTVQYNSLAAIGVECNGYCPSPENALQVVLPNGGFLTGSQFAATQSLHTVYACRLSLPCFDGRVIQYADYAGSGTDLEAECNNLLRQIGACWLAENMQLAPWYVAPVTSGYVNVCDVCEVSSFVAQAASAGESVVYALSVPSELVAGVAVSACSTDGETGQKTWYIAYGTRVVSVSYNSGLGRWAVALDTALVNALPNDHAVSIAYYGLATTQTAVSALTVSGPVALGAETLTVVSPAQLPADVKQGTRLYIAGGVLKPGTVVVQVVGSVLTLSEGLAQAIEGASAEVTYNNVATECNPLLISQLYECESPALAPTFPLFKLYDFCYNEVTSCSRDLLCQPVQGDIDLCGEQSEATIVANFFNGHDLLGATLSGVQLVKVENGVVYGRALPGAAKNLVHCVKLCMKCVTGDVSGQWSVDCGENRRLTSYTGCAVEYDEEPLSVADQCWTQLESSATQCVESSSADFCVMYPDLQVNLHSSFDCSGAALSQRISVNQLYVQRNANSDAIYEVNNVEQIEPQRLSLTVLATDFTPAAFAVGGADATRLLAYLNNNGAEYQSTVELVVQSAQWLDETNHLMLVEVVTASGEPIAPVSFQASQPLPAGVYLQLPGASAEKKLRAGMAISGGGLPASATIASIDTINHFVYVNLTLAQTALPIAGTGTVYSAQPTIASVRFLDSIEVGSDYLLPNESPSRIVNATWATIGGGLDPQEGCDAETQPVLDNDILAAGSIEIDSAFPVRGGLVNNKIFNLIGDATSDFSKISIHRALRVVLKDAPDAPVQSEFADNQQFGSARTAVAPAGSPWYSLALHSNGGAAYSWEPVIVSSVVVGYTLILTLAGVVRTGPNDAYVVEPGTASTPSGYELHSIATSQAGARPTTFRLEIAGHHYLALIIAGGVSAHVPNPANCNYVDIEFALFNCSDSDHDYIQNFPVALGAEGGAAVTSAAFGVRNTIVSHAGQAGHECLPYAVTLACDLVSCNDGVNFTEFSSYQVRDQTQASVGGNSYQRQDLYNDPTSASRAFYYVFATAYGACAVPALPASALAAAPEFFYQVNRLGAQQSFVRADPAACAPQQYLLLITSPGDGNVYVRKLLRNTFANSASMQLAVFRPSNGGLSVVRSAEIVVRVSLGAESGLGDDWAAPRGVSASRSASASVDNGVSAGRSHARIVLAAERKETAALGELDRARTALANTPQWIETDRSIMLAARGGARRVTKERVPNPAFEEAQARVERATSELARAQTALRAVTTQQQQQHQKSRNGQGLGWTECVYFYMACTEFATTAAFYDKVNKVLHNLPMVNPDKVANYLAGTPILASDLLCYKISLRINDGPELPAIPLSQCVAPSVLIPDEQAWDARIFPHTVEQVHVSGAVSRALSLALSLGSSSSVTTGSDYDFLMWDATTTVRGAMKSSATQTYTAVSGGSAVGCPLLYTQTAVQYTIDVLSGFVSAFQAADALRGSLSKNSIILQVTNGSVPATWVNAVLVHPLLPVGTRVLSVNGSSVALTEAALGAATDVAIGVDLQINNLNSNDAGMLTNSLQWLKNWVEIQCILQEDGSIFEWVDAPSTPEYALSVLKLLWARGELNAIALLSNYTGL